jgi:hypothetical protein
LFVVCLFVCLFVVVLLFCCFVVLYRFFSSFFFVACCVAVVVCRLLPFVVDWFVFGGSSIFLEVWLSFTKFFSWFFTKFFGYVFDYLWSVFFHVFVVGVRSCSSRSVFRHMIVLGMWLVSPSQSPIFKCKFWPTTSRLAFGVKPKNCGWPLVTL